MAIYHLKKNFHTFPFLYPSQDLAYPIPTGSLLQSHYLYISFYLVFLDFYNTILTEVNCPFRFGPHPPIVTLSIFLFINVLSP